MGKLTGFEMANVPSCRKEPCKALPGDGDPLDAKPPRNHRIIASRKACPWISFDIMALGAFECEAEEARGSVQSSWLLGDLPARSPLTGQHLCSLQPGT